MEYNMTKNGKKKMTNIFHSSSKKHAIRLQRIDFFCKQIMDVNYTGTLKGHKLNVAISYIFVVQNILLRNKRSI